MVADCGRGCSPYRRPGTPAGRRCTTAGNHRTRRALSSRISSPPIGLDAALPPRTCAAVPARPRTSRTAPRRHPTSIRPRHALRPEQYGERRREHRLHRHRDRRAGRGQMRLRPGLDDQRQGARDERHVEHAAPSPRSNFSVRPKPPGSAPIPQTAGDHDHLQRGQAEGVLRRRPGAETDDVQRVQTGRGEREQLTGAQSSRPRSDSTPRPMVARITATQAQRPILCRRMTAASSGVKTTYMPVTKPGDARRGVPQALGLDQLGDAVGDAEGNGPATVEAAEPGDGRRVHQDERDRGDQEAQRQVVGDVHPGEQILGQEERGSPSCRDREQGQDSKTRVVHAAPSHQHAPPHGLGKHCAGRDGGSRAR